MMAGTTWGRDLQIGVRLGVVTVVWMVLEADIALGAGIHARSFLLTAFESRNGDVEPVKDAEHKASWFVAITLGLLCLYVLGASIYGPVISLR